MTPKWREQGGTVYLGECHRPMLHHSSGFAGRSSKIRLLWKVPTLDLQVQGQIIHGSGKRRNTNESRFDENLSACHELPRSQVIFAPQRLVV